MISREQARQIAQRVLDRSPASLVLTGDQEFDEGWVFFYDSVRHQQTGSILDALAGNAPILVDRDTGQVYGTGTAQPAEHYIEQHRERKRRARGGWPEGLDDRFTALLSLVRDGTGFRSGRHIELLINRRFPPRGHATVLDELAELERRGLVGQRPASQAAIGCRWQITDAGLESLGG